MRKLSAMMRKLSAMGSSRFEYEPQELDQRYKIRQDIYASAYADVMAALELALSKADGDIVTRQSLEDWLCQELVKEFIKRRG